MTEDLRQRMDEAFSAFSPAPAPVDAAVRGGKRIRWRRRAVAAACVAAVGIAAVVVPLSFHPQAAAPATGQHGSHAKYAVTVQPPGPDAPEGLIATGTVNGKNWQYTVGAPGKDGASRGEQMVTASGPAFVPVQRQPEQLFVPRSDSAPAYFDPQWGETTAGLYGAVRSDVDHLTVRLTNGTTLTLHPVAAFGARLIAFAVPRGAVIVRVTAYSRTGVLATATPYYDSAQDAQWDMWFKPGGHSPSRASGRIGSGTYHGQAWSVSAITGPWGVCFMLFGNAMCTPLTDTNIVESMGSGAVQLWVGDAGPTVARIVVTGPHGLSVTVRPVTVGGRAFFVFATGFTTGTIPATLHWTAYDAAGHRVAADKYEF